MLVGKGCAARPSLRMGGSSCSSRRPLCSHGALLQLLLLLVHDSSSHAPGKDALLDPVSTCFLVQRGKVLAAQPNRYSRGSTCSRPLCAPGQGGPAHRSQPGAAHAAVAGVPGDDLRGQGPGGGHCQHRLAAATCSRSSHHLGGRAALLPGWTGTLFRQYQPCTVMQRGFCSTNMWQAAWLAFAGTVCRLCQPCIMVLQGPLMLQCCPSKSKALYTDAAS